MWLLSVIFAMTQLAQAQHVSNGGNFVSAEFVTKARLLLEHLQERPSHALHQHLSVRDLARAIDLTPIEVRSGSGFRDSLGRPADAVVEPFPCPGVGQCRIVLRQEFWFDALRSDLNVYRLILHEYLRVLRIADDSYAVSALLNASLQDFERNGRIEIDDLINIDFEKASDGLATPLGWMSTSVNYGYGFATSDQIAYQGRRSLVIASNPYGAPLFSLPGQTAFGSVVQCFEGEPYRGKNVHISGFIKPIQLYNGFASLWLRVDGTNWQTLLLSSTVRIGAGIRSYE